MACRRNVIALVHDPHVAHAWVAALAFGDRLTSVRLTLDRVGQPDLRPVLDLPDDHELAEQRKLIVVVPRFEDRDDQACFASHVRCSFSSPSGPEMVVLSESEVIGLLGVGEDVVDPLNPIVIRAVVERDLGIGLLDDLDAGAVRAVAWLVAGRRDAQRREPIVRVIGSSNASDPKQTVGAAWSPTPSDAVREEPASASAIRRSRPEGKDAALYLTIERVADELGVSVPTVRRLVRSATLAVVRIGRQLRVRREDLDKYVAQARRPSSEDVAVERRASLHALGVRLPRRRAMLVPKE